MLTRLTEYSGQDCILVAATQLGTDCSSTQARRIVDEWAEFFASGPSPIRHLRFVTRTPKRLFEALRGQTQLETLTLKWGDYADLSPLVGMEHLHRLHLGGASAIENLKPLAGMATVEDLTINGLRRARNLSPIGDMTGVRTLELGGDWMSPRTAHIDSLGFLRSMTQLQSLDLHTIKPDDGDYTPLLALPNLTSASVNPTQGMRPSFDVLRARLPWRE